MLDALLPGAACSTLVLQLGVPYVDVVVVMLSDDGVSPFNVQTFFEMLVLLVPV